MAKGIKRCADASSLDAVNAGAVLKKNRQGSDGLSSDSTSFQDVSKNILALCAEFEASTTPDTFNVTLSRVWDCLIALRVKRKLVVNYSNATASKSRTDAEATWIVESFNSLVQLLKSRINSGPPKLSAIAFTFLLEGIRVECSIRLAKDSGKSAFPLRQLDFALETLVRAPRDVFSTLVVCFTEHFIQRYNDIRFYALHSLDALIGRLLDTFTSEGNSVDDRANLSHHIYVLLQSFPSPKELETKPDVFVTDRYFTPEGITRNRSNDARAYKNAFCACWTRYLRLDHQQLQLPTYLYKEILNLVPTRLLPFLESPLLLTKFFLTAFHQDNISVAVQALSGLLYLLVKGRLGEPQLVDATGSEFYSRLLSLLQPSVFHLPVRARFLRLLQVSLQSRMLPTSMRGVFVKKLVSVSLLTFPGASLWLLALALRLMQLGGSATMKSLISQHITPDDIEQQDPLAQDDSDGDTTGLRLVPYSDRISGWETNITDLIKSETSREALLRRISLWELNLARLHWNPSVARFTKLYHTDIFKPTAPRVNPDAFLAADTAEMLVHELKNLLKKPDALEGIPLNVRLTEATEPCLTASLLRAGCACI